MTSIVTSKFFKHMYMNSEFLQSDSSRKRRSWFRQPIFIADVNVGDAHFKVLQHISEQSLDE